MEKNLPCILPSGSCKLSHSVRVRRLDSTRIRRAKDLAGAGALGGKVLRFCSFILNPYFSSSLCLAYNALTSMSSVKSTLFSILLNFLLVPIAVAVRSVGFQPAEYKTSTTCLCELGLNSLHAARQKGPPLYPERSPSSTKRKSLRCRVPCLV